jgi:hypothetical protein
MRAALSLDLDNKWSYMKTHGDAAWQAYPSYINALVPRALDLLDDLGVRITFFIVGQDAAMPQHDDALGSIATHGHEIGNHSFHHEPWMHRRSDAEIIEELARAEESIQRATGEHPRGFRGPGFTRSKALLEILAGRNYIYDASSLPTFIGPLARAYYFRSAKLSREQAREREDLFGKLSDGLRPNRQHTMRLARSTIAEVPVTTFPLIRLPIHVSYVLYIATVSPALALAYFRCALIACKITRTEPSILLHPLDFLTARDCPELGFFPAMNLDPAVKGNVLRTALEMLVRGFNVVPLREFVQPEVSYSPFATSAS